MKMKKAVAVILCSTLMGMSLCSCTPNFSVSDAVDAAKVMTASDEDILTDVVNKVAGVGCSEAYKEETVYVKTDASGNAESVIVSNHLKNEEGTAELQDETQLKDIVNVKGSETYKADGTKLTWEAGGNDIYYQGTTDKKIPVDVNITYELDSKQIEAEDLAGKSGHVVITINYKNNSANTVTIGDKEETIYTPFAAVSALSLDEEKFTNIKVTGGAAVSDGKRNIIVGMAFPGLVESLNGGKTTDVKLLEDIEEEISIPEKVVIEADVADYESGMVITLVTSDISRALGLDAIDLDSNTSVADIKESMDDFKNAGDDLKQGTKDLRDGAQQLTDGSKNLVEGTNSLYGGIVDYTNGVGKVAGGAADLKNGAVSLDEGAGKIQNGIGQAKDGAESLSNGISSVESGAKQVSDGAATLNEKVSELSAGTSSLREGVDALTGQVGEIASGVGSAASAAGQISAGIDQVIAAASVATDPASIDVSSVSVTGTVSGETAAAAMVGNLPVDTLKDYGFTDEQIQVISGVVSQVSANVIPVIVDNATDATAKQVAAQSAANGANQAKQQIAAALTTQGENGQSLQSGAAALASGLSDSYAALTSEESQAKLAALSSGAAALEAGAAALGEGTKQLADGAGALYSGTTQLSNGAGSLVGGLSELYTGAGTLKDGTGSLIAGTSQLADGASKLNSASGSLLDGSKALADGSAKLSDGIAQLSDGTVKLNDGMIKFNEEGIEKLTKIFDTDLEGMKERISAISEMGKSYNTFAGAAEGEDSTVKFIIESAEIKKL